MSNQLNSKHLQNNHSSKAAEWELRKGKYTSSTIQEDFSRTAVNLVGNEIYKIWYYFFPLNLLLE